jgi:LuxR family transcriptional regulator, maltose regulon positive regulatory protein
MTAQVSTIPVLETKLFIPRWPADLVARPALIERIRDGLRGRLTVVAAPAGSGKTTLLSEWLARRAPEDPSVAWVSLDAGDNEPAFFWTCIVRALQRVQPDLGQQALATLQAGTAPSVGTLAGLLNEITSRDCDVILVLDDYHVIEAPAVHTALAFVLDHLPPRMHVILATRADPPLPLARMRALGHLRELRTKELRFSPDEMSVFLKRVMTLDVAAADVAVLEQRTEGWIAGLKLAALSMQGQEDVSDFIHSFSGDNRYVADYLIEEVLLSQPEQTRRFLLATSILERLNASLCDAVTGESGSQALLDSLEKRNLFVIALDDRRGWYRYHHLFADVLEAYAVREDPALVRTLHGRASAWYELNGATSDAVRHAQDAADMERVAGLLEHHWPPKNRSHESRRWLEHVKSLPEAVVKARPALDVGYAWALLNAGELEAAELRLAQIELSLDPDLDPALAREAATARVYLAQSRGDGARTTEHAQRALELAPAGDHAARATGYALLALAQWAEGELAPAHDTFSAALDSMRRAGTELDAIRGEFVLGDIRAMQGRLKDAVRIYEAGLALAASHAGAESDELYLGLSEVHLERGELERCSQLLVEIADKSARAVHFTNRYRWCIAMARLAEAQADPDRALRLLVEAEGCHRRDPLPVVRSVAAMKTRVLLAQGDVAAAATWAAGLGLRSDDALSFLREYDHITLARVLIARGSLDEGIALLQRLGSAARAGGRLRSVIETLALEALAQHRLGNMRAALDAISSALELAEPESCLRVFADEGTPMRELLRLAAARGIAGAWTRRVLAGFEDGSDYRQQTATAARSATPRLLTTREHEILRLIAAGMRNQEIARQLFISPATVKRHIANVYNKLDAGHRTEALNRATTLNLL